MELEVFAGQEKSELSMIEVARAILELRGRDHEMHFSDLVNEIQNYLGTSNSDIREALPLFYTELNFDGSFISLGDNKWGLRSWYGVDEIDEEIIALEENDDDEVAPKAKKKRVNAFMDGDSDAIDYNADDAEINEIAPDDLGEDVDLNEDDDEFSDDDAETSEE
ncbi:DNA-directed RNA polymerase subunit delta [Streptococcus pneumoniae]|uniref:DNA-directed RNA polymerase subunit delta n=1 Tax=Streptococcus pneumoniae TaxID=1313 RepID=UPI0005176B14|nr:DNA-directed RNA polymerase subunit delta [Streptococcus pneumoniae]